MKPGIYSGVSSADYHRSEALGSTSLKTLATKTPAHYKWDQAHPKHSDAFTLGTAAHSLILEDSSADIVVIEAENWLTKAAKEAKTAALAAGKQPLLMKEWLQVQDMQDAVMAHPKARELLTGHKAEESVFWDEDGLMLKCRPDAWKPGQLVDLKTTVNADPREFGKVAYKFGYHQSAAHYIDGVKVATGEDLPFTFVLVEKTAPYLVSVVELDELAVAAGRDMNVRAKAIYRECTETGNWPGYPESEPVSLPSWASYEMDDLLGNSYEMEI